MGNFLHYNKQKLGFAYRFIALLFLTCCIILLSLAYFSGQFPNAQLLIIILITAGIFLPGFILIIVWLRWEYSKWKFNRLLGYLSFSTQEEGYTIKLHNQESKWFFTEEIMTKNINGFEVLLMTEKEQLQFAIFTSTTNAGKRNQDFKSKIKSIGISEIGYNCYGISFSKKQIKNIKYVTIEKKLITLITLFKHYGFEPI